MRFLPRIPRLPNHFPSCLAMAMALSLAGGPAGAAGFQNGEVQANSVLVTGGSTTTAAQMIDMSAVSPPISTPPPPPSSAPAVTTLKGTMTSVRAASNGSITSNFNQLGSNGVSLVEFTDSLFVTADGIPTGTPLVLAVTWNVSGAASFTTSTPNIKNRAKLLVEADGVNLNPDPNATPPPKQQWTRDRSNFTPEQFDPFGPITFEFLVKAGVPEFDGNLRLRAVAGFLVGAPGSIYSGSYSVSGNAELTLAFVGATNVRTTDGQTLYKWNTNALSGLTYGSRNDTPPSNPTLTVGPSPGGAKFSALSWNTVGTEVYRVQAAPDGSTWTTITEVRGTGSPVSIEVINPYPATTYRLLTDFGTGNPAAAPAPATLCVAKTTGGNVMVAWPTRHWENYLLNQVMPDGSKTLVQAVSGNGGVSRFEYPPTAPGRIFQVESALK